jgi:addiction module HigA family antidote
MAVDQRRGPRPRSHPGTILRQHYLEPWQWPLHALAGALGVPVWWLHAFVAGHLPVTPTLAERLAQVCHTSPELWMTLQRQYDQTVGRPHG